MFTGIVEETGRVLRRTDARLEISADAYFDSDQSAIRGIVRFDLVAPNPEAVVRITGIVP